VTEGGEWRARRGKRAAADGGAVAARDCASVSRTGQPQCFAAREEEAEGIRMDAFFNKLADRASGGVKAQGTRRCSCWSVRRFVLGSNVRRVALPQQY
jgi:hypothetical protein